MLPAGALLPTGTDRPTPGVERHGCPSASAG